MLDILCFSCYNCFINMVKVVKRVKQIAYNSNMTGFQIEKLASDLLVSMFEQMPVVRNVFKNENINVSEEKSFDIELEIEFNYGATCRVFGQVKSNGEKRIIRQVIDRYNKLKNMYREGYFVVVAPYISEASAILCEENNVGYIDFCGNCVLKYKNFYINVKGISNKYTEKREYKNFLTRNAVVTSKILREILSRPYEMWQVQKLSQLTGTSMGAVSNLKKFLQNKEWCHTVKAGFIMDNIKELLYEWANDYNKVNNVSYEFYSLDNIAEIERQLYELWRKRKIQCTLGAFSAAARYNPTVRYNKVYAYISEEDFSEVVQELELKKVESGGNIVLTLPYDSCVLYNSVEKKDGFVTSPVQTVLDLLAHKNRGEEAADAIIQKEYGHNERQ